MPTDHDYYLIAYIAHLCPTLIAPSDFGMPKSSTALRSMAIGALDAAMKLPPIDVDSLEKHIGPKP